MDFFTRSRELKLNNHYYEESEDFIEKSPQPFLQSFLEYFKLSGMVSVYLLSWNQIAYVSGLEIGKKKKHSRYSVLFIVKFANL